MIHVIPEGQTEQKIVERLLQGAQFQILSGEGKDKIASKLRAVLVANHTDRVRCLILRDLDAHVGETPAGIQQSIQNTVRSTLQELGYDHRSHQLTLHHAYPSVSTLVLSAPDLRLALHLAIDRWHAQFIKSTIDDYVLRLGLQPATAAGLVIKNGWSDVQPEEVIRKITDEIPALLTGNHIPLREAKDYVRLYAAIMQTHTSPPIFAEKVLANALTEDINAVFASLWAAIGFLRGEGDVF
jgi:hypothetical protein